MSLVLDGDRCRVRSFRFDDEVDLARAANDRRIWLNLRDRFPFPYTREDARDWLAYCATQRPELGFAIADLDSDRPVGGIGLELRGDVYARTAEIGYWLSPTHWGRGLATCAVSLVSDWAFASLDILRLEAGVFSWNPASAKVLEKCGFVLEGRHLQRVWKDGRVGDELAYARLRR
jgi:ribosomal-protein-alanine N-acetyltransferase